MNSAALPFEDPAQRVLGRAQDQPKQREHEEHQRQGGWIGEMSVAQGRSEPGEQHIHKPEAAQRRHDS